VRFGQNPTTRAFVLRSSSIRRFTPFTCSYSGIARGSPCLGGGRFSILSSCKFPVKQLTRIEIESTKDLGMPARRGRIAASALLTSAGKHSQSPCRQVIVGYRDAAVRISHSSSILSRLCFCRSRWPTHRCKLGKTFVVTCHLGCGSRPNRHVAALESQRSMSAPRRQLMATTQSATSNATDGLQCLPEDVATVNAVGYRLPRRRSITAIHRHNSTNGGRLCGWAG
jgi:hypothetical protein